MKLLLNRLSGYEGILACGCMGSAAIFSVVGRFHLVDTYRHQLERFVRLPIRLPLETPLPPAESWAYDILLFLLVCFGFGFAASALRHGPAQNRRFACLCLALFLVIVACFVCAKQVITKILVPAFQRVHLRASVFIFLPHLFALSLHPLRLWVKNSR